MSIRDWPASQRPREKLLKNDAASLSETELLTIFLRVGIKCKNAVDLARELLSHFERLRSLLTASQEGFCAIPGLGPAKYAQLQATLEMAPPVPSPSPGLGLAGEAKTLGFRLRPVHPWGALCSVSP